MNISETSISTEENPNKYIFNLSSLQKGDILLSSEDTKISRAIRTVTDGQFSHAMLYVGNSVIHATLDGVYSKNPQRLLFNSPEKIIALRSKKSLTDTQINIIEEEARSLVGSLYSIYEAGKSQLKHLTTKKSNTQKQYCSKLVAQCYAKAGIKIVQNPDYCSPNEISRSEHIQSVNNYFKLATEQDLAILKKHDYNLDLQQATFKWLRKARDLSSKNKGIKVHTVNDAFSFLIKNSKFDKIIAKEMEDSGYLNFYNSDRTANPYRYSKKDFINQINTSGLPPEEFIKPEQHINDTEWLIRTKNFQTSIANYDKFPLESMRLEKTLNFNMTQELLFRMEVLADVKNYFNI